MNAKPLDLKKVRVYPLASRKSEASLESILIPAAGEPPPCKPLMLEQIKQCARRIVQAREKSASIILMYGAHLLKNGGSEILIELIRRGWVTHLATNGAGTIHDWEFAFLGRSTESVQKNVATGTFGTWDETGRYIHLALLAGALEGKGYGQSLGEFIFNEQLTLPSLDELMESLKKDPGHPFAAARAELLQALMCHKIPAGTQHVPHPWKQRSVLAQAAAHGVCLTVHPGIGYDIIANHPMFNGAVIGRAASYDFALFAGAVAGLDGGLTMSVGSAIMGPQVFEKSMSCANNLRLQAGQEVLTRHEIYVVDIQDGGNWDWTKGEPPKENPAYYLRFCKSFSRMGGPMHYLCIDNVAFLHNLLIQLQQKTS